MHAVFCKIDFFQQELLCPKNIPQLKTSLLEKRKEQEEIVSHPEKELHFLMGWIVIMTVLLNRLMWRTVLLEPCVPSLWRLNAFVFGGADNLTVSPHCKATMSSASTKLSKQWIQMDFLTVKLTQIYICLHFTCIQNTCNAPLSSTVL